MCAKRGIGPVPTGLPLACHQLRQWMVGCCSSAVQHCVESRLNPLWVCTNQPITTTCTHMHTQTCTMQPQHSVMADARGLYGSSFACAQPEMRTDAKRWKNQVPLSSFLEPFFHMRKLQLVADSAVRYTSSCIGLARLQLCSRID